MIISGLFLRSSRAVSCEWAAGSRVEVLGRQLDVECAAIFAHVLDMRDGLADGVPLLASAAERRAWLDVLMPEYDAFSERVVCGHETVLDPYAAESPDEFTCSTTCAGLGPDSARCSDDASCCGAFCSDGFCVAP